MNKTQKQFEQWALNNGFTPVTLTISKHWREERAMYSNVLADEAYRGFQGAMELMAAPRITFRRKLIEKLDAFSVRMNKWTDAENKAKKWRDERLKALELSKKDKNFIE